MPDGVANAPVKAASSWSPDGVHLLRTTQQIQYQLSQMADTKANMLLGVTFLIFTISVGQARDGRETVPLLVLGASAFAAAVLAVMAVLPSVKKVPPPSGPAGLLFFGSFTQLSEQEYVDRLAATAGESAALYEAFARDIYQHGRVLAGRKYLLLAWAYRVLLVGLVLSLLAFIGQYALHLF
jgi:hypothetical protein